MQLELIFIGITMGIAFAAPPGAVTAETLRRGARGGFALAFGVQAGSLVGDATYAALALAGLAALAQNHALQIAFGAFGAMLMYLAWSAFQSARLPLALTPSGASQETRGAFLSGFALSLANPWAIAFWLSLGGALASWGIAGADAQAIALFFASFTLGSTLWAIALSCAIGRARDWMRPALFRLVSIVCAISLGAFGLLAAMRVVESLSSF